MKRVNGFALAVVPGAYSSLLSPFGDYTDEENARAAGGGLLGHIEEPGFLCECAACDARHGVHSLQCQCRMCVSIDEALDAAAAR